MPEDNVSRIILNDSVVLENCDGGYYDKSLWCYLRGYTFSEAFQLFSSPEHFEKVVCEYGMKHYYKRVTYTGFTSITAIEQREFTVDVRLEGDDIHIDEQIISQEGNQNESELEGTV